MYDHLSCSFAHAFPFFDAYGFNSINYPFLIKNELSSYSSLRNLIIIIKGHIAWT